MAVLLSTGFSLLSWAYMVWVSPVLALLETQNLLPGTRDDLELQLLLHVGTLAGLPIE